MYYDTVNPKSLRISLNDDTQIPYEELVRFANTVRAHGAPKHTGFAPDTTSTVPGRPTEKTVKLQLYHPPGILRESRRPVMINWHGSGFVIPALGHYGAFCRYVFNHVPITVIDADYPKAPENPFPAALQASASTIKWVLAQEWCNGCIILCGFSAGATMAITLSNPTLAAQLGLESHEIAAIKLAVAVYPAIDMNTPVSEKPSNEGPLPNGIPGALLSKDLMEGFTNCYFHGSPLNIRTLPLASPAMAESKLFTTPLLIIPCEHCPLLKEARDFFERLDSETPGRHKYFEAKGVGHGYELRIPPIDSVEFCDATGARTKLEVYSVIITKISGIVKQR